MKTEKLNDNTKTTANSTQLEFLKKNFPNCFDRDGNFNPNKLSEIVKSTGADISKESYGINWLGKSYARLLANETPLTLITEDKEHNTKEENKDSENMLIKGDNLEVLKHLKNAYSESIKMIYIDPPYNTGDDGFIYNDDRKFTAEQLSELAGIDTNEARRILEFTNSNSNSHSAWLTFMYPRLYIARELLKEDGVIFISIDDNEASQLKLLCDEIFGEANFVANFLWKRKKEISSDSKNVSMQGEYLVAYSKSSVSELNSEDLDEKYIEKSYSEANEIYDKGLWRAVPITVSKGLSGGGYEYTITAPNGKKHNKLWAYPKESYEKLLKQKIVYFGKNGDAIPQKVIYASASDGQPTTNYWDNVASNKDGKKRLLELFEENIFTNPKPTELLNKCLSLGTNKNDIILDFFAGSGTTGDAVMQLNAKDGGKRKYICVQLDEPIDKKSEAYKFCIENNLPTVISSITQERLIRAGKQIVDKYKTGFKPKDKEIECEECGKKHKSKQKAIEPNPNFTLDTGFKVYETKLLINGLSDTLDNDFTQIELFDSELSVDDIQAILTTYKVHDGANLNADLLEIKLDKYTAYTVEDKIYFIDTGFTTSSLKVFIEKLDTDKNFKPTKLVIFGYNFDSKHQREIKEAIHSYTNKKSLEIDMVVRY